MSSFIPAALIVDLTGTTYIGQIYGVDFANFVASSEYMNFTKKCHIFSFGEKKYVIVLLFITDAKKILFFSCAHCCFCSCFFFLHSAVCCSQFVASAQWNLPKHTHSTSRAKVKKLKTRKILQQHDHMKVNQTQVYKLIVSNARISANNQLKMPVPSRGCTMLKVLGFKFRLILIHSCYRNIKLRVLMRVTS